MKNDSNRMVISPLAIICSMLSIAAFMIMLLNSNEQNVYFATSFLPLCFGFFSFFSGYLYKNINKSPVSLFLIGGYFIRMVIQPLLFCIGGYTSLYHCDITSVNILKSVILLFIENAVVFMVANYFSRKNFFNDFQSIVEPIKYDTKLIGWILVILGAFLLYAYNTIPSLKSIYLFLPTADISQLAYIRWDNETIVARGTVSRYIYTLFMFVWPIVRAILPAFCISQIYAKHGNNTKAVALSIICLLIPSIFLSGDNIAPFMGAIYGLIVMHRLFGRKTRKIIIVIGIVFGTAFFTIVSAKVISYQNWRGANGISSVAQIVNSYFPGFENISICFSIDDKNKLSTLFYDLYYAIPFKETLFGLSGDTLSTLYTQTSQTSGQIVPWAGQLSHYFTIIGSPIITALFVSHAYKCELISKSTNNFWEYYIKMYISVLTAISISIYSVSIYIRSYLNVLIPVILIIVIGNRKKTVAKNKAISTNLQSGENEE